MNDKCADMSDMNLIGLKGKGAKYKCTLVALQTQHKQLGYIGSQVSKNLHELDFNYSVPQLINKWTKYFSF